MCNTKQKSNLKDTLKYKMPGRRSPLVADLGPGCRQKNPYTFAALNPIGPPLRLYLYGRLCLLMEESCSIRQNILTFQVNGCFVMPSN